MRSRKLSRREEENRQLANKIKAIFDDEKSRAGALRITKRLNNEGTPVGRHRVAKIMRLYGWRARAAKKFKATTNSNHQLPVAPNLLQQNFSAHRPNEKWVSDITYIWTEEGYLYLAVVMDLCSRKVVGWALCERMTKANNCVKTMTFLSSRRFIVFLLKILNDRDPCRSFFQALL